MQYCTRCIYPSNHPLNITFDEQGVCSGCRIHEEKDALDWKERENKLKEILNNYKSVSKSQYDCIIPVSGARDSFFIVHMVKNVYGMKPLLVTYNKHYNTDIGIRNLASLQTIFDCDLLTLTVQPEIVKRITRSTLRKMGSIYWHCLAGQTVFPVQTAVRFKIPLIIWGAHQGIDQVGMFSHTDEVEMTRKYRKEHDLMGCEAEDIADESLWLQEKHLYPFIYPHDKDLEIVGVRGIYLNNYIRWDTKKQHELMIKLYGYESFPQERTFDTYNDVDCFNYSDTHDYIKFLKYGYGKVTDHVCREIRLKRMTREEGIEFVKKYQDKKPKYLPLFLDWLGITERGFYYFINQFRDKEAWKREEDGQWLLKDPVQNNIYDANIETVRLPKTEECNFQITPLKKAKKTGGYILLGKGFVNNEDKNKERIKEG